MGCGDSGDTKCAETWAASAAGVMDVSLSFFFFFFFEPLVAGDQKASLASLSPYLRPFRHLEGSLFWGPSLCFSASGT